MWTTTYIVSYLYIIYRSIYIYCVYTLYIYTYYIILYLPYYRFVLFIQKKTNLPLFTCMCLQASLGLSNMEATLAYDPKANAVSMHIESVVMLIEVVLVPIYPRSFTSQEVGGYVCREPAGSHFRFEQRKQGGEEEQIRRRGNLHFLCLQGRAGCRVTRHRYPEPRGTRNHAARLVWKMVESSGGKCKYCT